MTEGSFFHAKYFQGYSKRIVLDENGNPHVEYVYEGTYYTLDCPDGIWYRKKILYFALVLVCIGLLLAAMVTETKGNYQKDITFLEVVNLFLLLGNGIGAVSRVAAGRKMTQWEYRMSVATIREFSLLLVFFMAVLLLDEGISLAVGRLPFEPMVVPQLAELAAGVLLMFLLYKLVRMERYTTEISKDLPHGTDITNDFEPMG